VLNAIVVVVALYAVSTAVTVMRLLGIAICCLGCVELLGKGQLLLHYVSKSSIA